jgi:transposase
VRLVTIHKYSFAAAAKALGISEQSLRRWHSLLSPKPEPCGENATVDELRAENERLKRQLQRVELEREILKKPRRISRRSRCEICLDSRASRLVSHRRHVPSAERFLIRLLPLVRPPCAQPSSNYGVSISLESC